MKKMIMGAVGAAVLLAGLAITPAMADVQCPAGSARAGDTAKSFAECNLAATTTDLWDSVNAIINTILAVLGIVTVVIIIIGGVNYVLSQGDPGKIKKAKDTIMYGVIGLVIAFLAYSIVNFVLANVFGGNNSGGGDSASETTVVTNGEN